MLNHKSNTAIFGLLMLLLLSSHFFFTPIPLIFFVLPCLVYISIVIWGSTQIHSNYHVKTICKSAVTSSREIALTFDDGPSSSITPQVLALLKKYDVRATFFCIGKKLQGNESLLKQIVAEGHALGNHSYSHSYFFDFFGASKIEMELAKTNKQIEEICGKKIKLFRPPYGITTPNIAAAVDTLKLTTIGWNIRSFDAVSKDATKIIKRVNKSLSPGSIILFHDTHERILTVLEHVLEHSKKDGYKIVSIQHLLKLEPYV